MCDEFTRRVAVSVERFVRLRKCIFFRLIIRQIFFYVGFHETRFAHLAVVANELRKDQVLHVSIDILRLYQILALR